MNEIRHHSRSHTMHGHKVMVADDVSARPDLQPMLLRLGLAVGDVNAASIDRTAYVKQVAATIERLRAER